MTDKEERVTYFPNNTFRWSLIEHNACDAWIVFFNQNEDSKLGIRVSQGENVTLPIHLPENWELVT